MSVTKTEIQEALESTPELGANPEVLTRQFESLNHPVLAWLATLGASSRASMLAALRRGIGAVDASGARRPLEYRWGSLTHLDVLRIRMALEGKGRPASRNLSLVAIRGVAKSAWRLGLLGLEELQRIKEVRNFRFHGETQVGRFVPRADRTRLFRLSSAHPTVAIRDRALFALLLGSGLRRSEAASARRSDLHLEESIITINGKGGRVRRVPMSETVRVALATWLQKVPTHCESIFPQISRSGRLLSVHPMSGAAVAELLRRRTRQEALAPIRPHDLRRTCVSDALEAGCDLLAIQQLLGHSSPQTTARYDRRGEKSRHAAVAAVFVPG